MKPLPDGVRALLDGPNYAHVAFPSRAPGGLLYVIEADAVSYRELPFTRKG